MQRPLLLLTWSQTVAEGLPREFQPLIGQWLSHLCQVGVETAFAHPCTSEEHAVTIFFFICELTRGDSIALVDDAALQHLVTGEERVDDVLVLVRRTHLHIDGTAVGGELLSRSIEPVVSLHGGMLVLQAEHHELVGHRVLAADTLQRVEARLQVADLHVERLVGGSALGLFQLFRVLRTLEDSVDDISGNRLAGIVQIAERDAGHVVDLNVRGHAHAEGRSLVAQRQRGLAVVALAGCVSSVSLHHEVVEATPCLLVSRLRHYHRHLHFEAAFVVGGQRVGDKRLIAFGT